MTRYTSATERDREQMLAAIGARSIDDLFEDIPASVRLDRPLELPDGLPEAAVYERMAELAARNGSAETEITFLLVALAAGLLVAAGVLGVVVAPRLP